MARGAHAFHRFAHHPLCAEYAPEVLRLGRRTRLCRGCANALVGLALGSALGLGFPSALAAAAASACFWGGLPIWLGVRRSPSPRGGAAKRLTRALPLALVGYAIAGGMRAGDVLGWLGALAALLGLALAFTAYRRRGPDRSPCATCPERHLAPCRGMAEIWRREKAFQRAAGKLIAVANLAPRPR